MADEEEKKTQKTVGMPVMTPTVTIMEEASGVRLSEMHNHTPYDHGNELGSGSPHIHVERDEIIAAFDALCVRYNVPPDIRNSYEQTETDQRLQQLIKDMENPEKMSDRIKACKDLGITPSPEDVKKAEEERLSREALLAGVAVTAAGFAALHYVAHSGNTDSLIETNSKNAPPPPDENLSAEEKKSAAEEEEEKNGFNPVSILVPPLFSD